MAGSTEVERKFLVAEMPDGEELGSGVEIVQGYLAVGGGAEVRLRAKGGRCFITVKRGAGLERSEHEVGLERSQLDALWPATAERRVEKTRFEIPVGDLTAELDLYHGELDGLFTVEVEFSSAAAAALFEAPSWFGREVTEDERYKNKRLACEGLPRKC